MPKYTNGGTTQVTVGDVTIAPGQTVTTNYYLKNLPTGVTKVSDDPLPSDPVKVDASVTGTTTTVVPETINEPYVVTIYASSGDVTLKFNSDSDPITKKILSGGTYSRTCWKRSINDIRTTGNAQIRVEEI